MAQPRFEQMKVGRRGPRLKCTCPPLTLPQLSLGCAAAADEDDEEEKKPKTKKVTETVTEWKALNDNQVGWCGSAAHGVARSKQVCTDRRRLGAAAESAALGWAGG